MGIRDILAVIILIAFGVYYRLIPHEPNFSPLIPITVFCGFIISRKTNVWIAGLVPLAVLFISDFFIGFYKGMFFVYLSFIVCFLLSFVYSKFFYFEDRIKQVLNVNASALINSIVFFVISNFGVWLFSNMYDKTLGGLAECFFMALPFFKNSMLSAVIFTTLIFLSYYALEERKKNFPIFDEYNKDIVNRNPK
ncbi:MAG: DUF6580 family putative transport protein [bacterium]